MVPVVPGADGRARGVYANRVVCAACAMTNLRVEHHTNVTMLFKEQVNGSTLRNGQPKLKKSDSSKMILINMDSITRADFIKAFLPAHALETTYAPSLDKGPPFKLWFAGTRYDQYF